MAARLGQTQLVAVLLAFAAIASVAVYLIARVGPTNPATTPSFSPAHLGAPAAIPVPTSATASALPAPPHRRAHRHVSAPAPTPVAATPTPTPAPVQSAPAPVYHAPAPSAPKKHAPSTVQAQPIG